MAELVCVESNDSPVWGAVDVAIWKLAPEKFGGGIPNIQKFKDGWVKHNKATIIASAKDYALPQEFLAGVCWIEVGGDPNFIDTVAFGVRAFDWSGPEWVDTHLTMTNSPEKTSFGAVSMQLRTAAQTMGLNPGKMSTIELYELANCLQKDVFNIKLVARHLRQLVDHDDIKSSTTISTEQMRIAGARYNRGIGLSLEQIKENTSYGNFIVNNISRFIGLLQ